MTEQAYQTLTLAIQERLVQRRHIVVAIDGRCGSGKTTLAARLQGELDCAVVHMDDFFLRPEQRTQARLAQPGENVDHERFLEEVLLPLRAGKPAAYRPYLCAQQRLGEIMTVQPNPVVLVEGAYACHPQLWEHYDLRVFLTIDPQEQLRRIEARNGRERTQQFRERWIPLEEAYFRAFSLEAQCDLLLEG